MVNKYAELHCNDVETKIKSLVITKLKSMILVDACVDNLLRGRHCLFFSIEMSEREVFLRMVARYANFNYDQMSKKQLTKEENEQLIAKAIEFKERVKGRLQIYQNRSGILVKNIESHIAKRRKGGQQVDDVFIDYLQILEETTKPNKIEKMDELCKQVRQLKQKMGIRVFIPAQLGASAKTKPIEEINEFDIWYAKNLARECDILLILHNDQEYEKCTLMRYALARINYTDDVYFFPNADFNRAYIGEGQVYDKNKIEALAEKKHWRKRGQYDEEDNGKGDIDWMNFK